MTCPACKPDEPCSACLAEELARRHQQHLLGQLAKTVKRGPGQPRKGLVPLTVYVSPGFKERVKKAAGKTSLTQGEWLERECS
jgi:hypothetical protein